MPKKKMSIAEAQVAANKYMRDYMSNTPILPTTLDEETYKKIADGVMRAIVEAWAAGFMAAR